VTRSAAARGELADFDKARKGSSAFIARCCSMRGIDQRTLGVWWWKEL